MIREHKVAVYPRPCLILSGQVVYLFWCENIPFSGLNHVGSKGLTHFSSGLQIELDEKSHGKEDCGQRQTG